MSDRSDWTYRGIDTVTAETVSGTVSAATEAEALDAASKEGVVPLSVRRDTAMAAWLTTDTRKTAKRRDIAIFIRGYTTAASSNMRTEDALSIAVSGVRSAPLVRAVDDIIEMYGNGVPLYEAFAVHSTMFGEETAAVLEAGEASGQTHSALSALADAKERSSRIRGKIITAMVYPIVVLIAALGALAVIITFVLPVIEEVIAGLGQDGEASELPLLTSILIGVSDAVKANIVITLVVVVVLLLGAWMVLSTEPGKRAKATVALHAPLVGPVVRGLNTSMMCELGGVMLSAGVTQARTMELLSLSIRNRVLAAELEQIPQRLINGMELDTACKMSVPTIDPVIPSLAQQTASGLQDPGEPWRRYGSAIGEETDRRADVLKSAMEPLMIIIVGLVIGLMAAAVYMPLLKVYDTLETLQ